MPSRPGAYTVPPFPFIVLLYCFQSDFTVVFSNPEIDANDLGGRTERSKNKHNRKLVSKAKCLYFQPVLYSRKKQSVKKWKLKL